MRRKREDEPSLHSHPGKDQKDENESARTEKCVGAGRHGMEKLNGLERVLPRDVKPNRKERKEGGGKSRPSICVLVAHGKKETKEGNYNH